MASQEFGQHQSDPDVREYLEFRQMAQSQDREATFANDEQFPIVVKAANKTWKLAHDKRRFLKNSGFNPGILRHLEAGREFAPPKSTNRKARNG